MDQQPELRWGILLEIWLSAQFRAPHIDSQLTE